MEQLLDFETNFLLKLYLDSLDINCIILNKEKDVVFSSSSNQMAETILTGSEVLYEVLEQKENLHPVLFGTRLGAMWAACFGPHDLAYVLGPFLSAELSDNLVSETLNSYNISLQLKHKIMDFLQTVPVLRYNSIYPYAIMLHYILNKEKISGSDIRIFARNEKEDSIAISKKDRTRTWKAEQRLMKNIEDGNMNYKESLANARNLSYGMRISTGNPTRQIKNSLLTFVSLSARAAIRGGMTPEMAYTISDAYAEKIEDAERLDELSRIADEMFEEYIRKVHDLKKKEGVSDTIQTIIDHIDLHIEENITLSSLSEISGYSDYYLSRQFKNETGHSIAQYISLKKIEVAKNYIETSDLSIREISEKLSFASETYFSTVFKKITGESPFKYRKNVS